MANGLRSAFLFLLVAFGVGGCDQTDNAVCARMGSVAVSLGEIRRELQLESPELQAQVRNSSAVRRRYVENVAREIATFKNALAAGIGDDPEVTRAFRRIVNSIWLRRKETRNPVPTAPARQRSSAQCKTFRGRQIVVGSKEAAETLAAKLRKAANPDEAFAAAARTASIDAATRGSGGDIGVLREGHTGLAAPLDDALRRAQRGTIVGPVETGGKWFLLLKTDEGQALCPPPNLLLRPQRRTCWQARTRWFSTRP